MRDLATELASPKYAHIERERRWIANASVLDEVTPTEVTRIKDRYIDSSQMRLRRMEQSVTGAISRKLTKKYAAQDSTAQPIVTTYLNPQEFALLAQLPAAILNKKRYSFDHEDLEWSLDIFESPDPGFAVLEVEAEVSVLPTLTPPEWAGPEVTDDDRFSCGNLVRNPMQIER